MRTKTSLASKQLPVLLPALASTAWHTYLLFQVRSAQANGHDAVRWVIVFAASMLFCCTTTKYQVEICLGTSSHADGTNAVAGYGAAFMTLLTLNVSLLYGGALIVFFSSTSPSEATSSLFAITGFFVVIGLSITAICMLGGIEVFFDHNRAKGGTVPEK